MRITTVDVKNVFLHEALEKQGYMEIPPECKTHGRRNKACLLKKTLYGLKQSPRAWFGRITKAMISLGYKQRQRDHNSFIKHSITIPLFIESQVCFSHLPHLHCLH